VESFAWCVLLIGELTTECEIQSEGSVYRTVLPTMLDSNPRHPD
jgi:hypothetical protein